MLKLNIGVFTSKTFGALNQYLMSEDARLNINSTDISLLISELNGQQVAKFEVRSKIEGLNCANLRTYIDQKYKESEGRKVDMKDFKIDVTPEEIKEIVGAV